MDMMIRNLDIKSVQKLDEISKQKGLSRQQFKLILKSRLIARL